MATKKHVNVELDEKVHMKAKVIAVLKDTTLNDFIVDAIEEAIEKNKDVLDKIK